MMVLPAPGLMVKKSRFNTPEPLASISALMVIFPPAEVMAFLVSEV